MKKQAKLKDNDARINDEVNAVILLIAKDHIGTEDYNVSNDEEVDLFDDCGNVFKTITKEAFETYWDTMESEFDYSQYETTEMAL